MASTQPFRFLALPPEIRNRVYYEVLDGASCKIAYSSATGELDITHTDSNGEQSKGIPGILTVNKAIHHETKQLFQATTDFHFDSRATMRMWLETLDDEEIKAITKLTCRYYYDSCGFDLKTLLERQEQLEEFMAAWLEEDGLEEVIPKLWLELWARHCDVKMFPRESEESVCRGKKTRRTTRTSRLGRM